MDAPALPLLLLLPVLCAGASLLLRRVRTILRFCAWATAGVSALSGLAACAAFRRGQISAAGGWFMLDALSAYHLVVMTAIFVLSALYAVGYFDVEIERGEFTLAQARRYASLWFGSLSAMLLVLLSNNLGVMWVGIEATTLLTAFLICIHLSPGALEAMWKYLLMCSVGVAVAFTGTLLIAASTGPAGLRGTDVLLWTHLRESVSRLDPMLLKAGFIFLVVGYGTKAGLAPMHNWLPDAHSQAPAPVSALFSGFLLNAALYCILRCLPLVEAATGDTGWARGILVAFGLLSILVAAVFIAAQHDVKRLLAYHSVEHLGIIALGFGLGGLGTFAALFHTFNHSLCKSLSFFAAGRLGQIFKTHEMERMTGSLEVSPVWGLGIVASLLALIGMVPFSLFMSEFQMLKAAVDGGRFGVLVVFLFGTGTVFVGVLGNALRLGWGKPGPVEAEISTNWLDVLLVAAPLVVLLVLGVWMPGTFRAALDQAAAVVENVHRIVPVNLRGAP